MFTTRVTHCCLSYPAYTYYREAKQKYLDMPNEIANEFTEACNMCSGCRNPSVLKALLLSKCKDRIRNCKVKTWLYIRTVMFIFLSDRVRTLRNLHHIVFQTTVINLRYPGSTTRRGYSLHVIPQEKNPVGLS